MLINGDEYKTKAENNQLRDTEIAPNRGVIYDANGTVLARSASAWKIYINPTRIPEDEGVRNFLFSSLAGVLEDVDAETIREKTVGSKQSYVLIKSGVESEEKDKVTELLSKTKDYVEKKKNEDGETVSSAETFTVKMAVGVDPDVKRYYPCGTLAAAVIGFTGDGDEGRSGLEQQYNDVLAGTPGRLITAKNGRSDLMSDEFESLYEAKDGDSLVLTIDTNIQRYLDDGLRDVYEDSKGVGAYGIVMDVNTGAILAMGSAPGFDPNNRYALDAAQKAVLETITDEEEKTKARRDYYYSNWRNFNINDTYEPGSVFKIVTASAGLESGAVTMGFDYTCLGSIKVATETIKCNNHSGHGYQTLRQGLMNSCNPFFITVGQKMGKDVFCEFFDAFGFTEKTGIDLPGEATPAAEKTYHSYDKMGIVELSSSAFGQSFQVTPLQMVTAISAVANGGKLMQPYIVDKIIDSNGNVISDTEPTVRRQVISKETSELVSSMMEDVVTSGTGKNAYVAGYHVAGKTGTSQKLSKGAGYYVASFGCFAPAENPEIAVIIIVDEPVGQINGGQICTPIAARVIKSTLEYMNVEPEYTEEEREKLYKTMPDMTYQSIDDAKAQLQESGYTVRVAGNGETVVSQMPTGGSTVPYGGAVVLYTVGDSKRLTVTVPDFTGLTMSSAISQAAAAGLNIAISGNSSFGGDIVAFGQDTEVGEEVEYGSFVTVYFKTNSGVSEYDE